MNDMNGPDDRTLMDALSAVAEDDEAMNTSPAVEQRLLAEVRSIGRTRWSRSRVLQVAAAAALLAAVALPVWYASRRPPTIGDSAVSGEILKPAGREEATDFFPLAYSAVPAPGGYVVRMQVPRTVLDTFGVTGFSAPEDRSATVSADVFVGGDGLARAVRFVRVVPK